jgi:hypothetical protein
MLASISGEPLCQSGPLGFSGSRGVVIVVVVVVVIVVIDQVDRIFSLPLVAMDSASLRSPSATETWGK